MWNMEEICSKNDLIKDRSIALIPGHSVTYQMTPLSSSKTLGIFFFGYKQCRIGIGHARVVPLQGEFVKLKIKKPPL